MKNRKEKNEKNLIHKLQNFSEPNGRFGDVSSPPDSRRSEN